MSRRRKIVWYAATAHVRKAGPFPSHVKAAQAMMGLDGIPQSGFMAWPEYEAAKARCGKRKKV